VARWKPEAATEGFTSIGGNAAFRLIGGSLLPFSVNLQVGAARTDSANSTPARTAVTGAVGFSVRSRRRELALSRISRRASGIVV